MKKINLAISGCLGRMGQQLIKSSILNKNFKLVTLTENKILNKKIAGIKLNLNTSEAFKNIDIIIDFTVPDCTLEILKIPPIYLVETFLKNNRGDLQKLVVHKAPHL